MKKYTLLCVIILFFLSGCAQKHQTVNLELNEQTQQYEAIKNSITVRAKVLIKIFDENRQFSEIQFSITNNSNEEIVTCAGSKCPHSLKPNEEQEFSISSLELEKFTLRVQTPKELIFFVINFGSKNQE